MQPDREEMFRRSAGTFYCVFGHPNFWPKTEIESEQDRIRCERDSLKRKVARKDEEIARQRILICEAEEAMAAERRRVSAAKGQITKIKKRSAEGRCPCCNHVFVDLLSHMKSKHSDYEAQPIDFDEKPEEVTA